MEIVNLVNRNNFQKMELIERTYLYFVNVYHNNFNKDIQYSKKLAIEAIRNILALLGFYSVILLFVISNTCFFRLNKDVLKAEYIIGSLLICLFTYLIFFYFSIKKKLDLIDIDNLIYSKKNKSIFNFIVVGVLILSALFYIIGILLPKYIC